MQLIAGEEYYVRAWYLGAAVARGGFVRGRVVDFSAFTDAQNEAVTVRVDVVTAKVPLDAVLGVAPHLGRRDSVQIEFLGFDSHDAELADLFKEDSACSLPK